MTQLLWIQWINWMTILVCTYNKPLLNYGILSAIFNTIRNLATTRIPTDLYTEKAFLLNGCANSMTLYFGGNVEGGLLLYFYTQVSLLIQFWQKRQLILPSIDGRPCSRPNRNSSEVKKRPQKTTQHS